MAYDEIPLEKRIKENIKNYNLDDLLQVERLKENIDLLCRVFPMEVCFTDRHGVPYIVHGKSFEGFAPDVVENPGIKFRVYNRTLGHVYMKMGEDDSKTQMLAEEALSHSMSMFAEYAEINYLNREHLQYMDYLEKVVEKENFEAKRPEQKDVLTGTLNRTYFEERMKLLDKSGIAPVALIEVNINDWKYAYAHFGTEHSDRLLVMVAGVLKNQAKAEYIIGRYDGDVFTVLIPNPEDGEAENYCAGVIEQCRNLEDDILAPSVATGIAYKMNVEQKLKDLLSDAEYEMFEQKIKMKQEPGYYERLYKGTLNRI